MLTHTHTHTHRVCIASTFCNPNQMCSSKGPSQYVQYVSVRETERVGYMSGFQPDMDCGVFEECVSLVRKMKGFYTVYLTEPVNQSASLLASQPAHPVANSAVQFHTPGEVGRHCMSFNTHTRHQ